MATTMPRDISPPETKPTSSQKKQPKQKRTFMLHDPSSMVALGKFVSTDYRYAALKAASRGHTQIHLRQTGTREVRVFDGQKAKIEPKSITRGGRTVTYTHQPKVKFVRSFTFDGTVDENAGALNPVAQ
jgi:hypothetical protein